MEQKCDEIRENIKDLPREKSISISKELRKAMRISLDIDEFLKTISDRMIPQYSEVIKAIKEKLC